MFSNPLSLFLFLSIFISFLSLSVLLFLYLGLCLSWSTHSFNFIFFSQFLLFHSISRPWKQFIDHFCFFLSFPRHKVDDGLNIFQQFTLWPFFISFFSTFFPSLVFKAVLLNLLSNHGITEHFAYTFLQKILQCNALFSLLCTVESAKCFQFGPDKKWWH